MFFKYASNILQEVSDECMLKSFACENTEDAKMYRSIAQRIDRLIGRLAVEERPKPQYKEYE